MRGRFFWLRRTIIGAQMCGGFFVISRKNIEGIRLCAEKFLRNMAAENLQTLRICVVQPYVKVLR